jgi:hypothetical protein
MYFAFCFVVFGLVGWASCCGVTTHNLIAHRAWKSFEMADIFGDYLTMIENNQPSFQNGAAFPDFGYDCFLRVMNGDVRL